MKAVTGIFADDEKAVRGISFRFLESNGQGKAVAIWFEKELSLTESRAYFNSLFSQSNVRNAKYEMNNNNFIPSDF